MKSFPEPSLQEAILPIDGDAHRRFVAAGLQANGCDAGVAIDQSRRLFGRRRLGDLTRPPSVTLLTQFLAAASNNAAVTPQRSIKGQPA